MRRAISPTEMVKLIPQLFSIWAGANTKMIASNKNKIAVNTERR